MKTAGYIIGVFNLAAALLCLVVGIWAVSSGDAIGVVDLLLVPLSTYLGVITLREAAEY